MSKVIFVGPCGGNKIPNNGASIKNYYILESIKGFVSNLTIIDTENWREKPYILIKLFLIILFNPRAKFILSLNNMSAYRLISFIDYMPGKRNVVYWVIGGSIADWINTNMVKKKPYKSLRLFIVEGIKMKEVLNKNGFDNVVFLPNFKKITYIPNLDKFKKGEICKFVFLSRITQTKGTDYIIDAAKELNKLHQDKFTVDFFGPIDQSYESTFFEKISHTPNVNYRGFIDLKNAHNYDILCSYDVLLFPTYWHGEGFPGVIIDAFIAGLPVIASDWSQNASIIKNGKTGYIIPVHSLDALKSSMEIVLANKSSIRQMAVRCQQEALNYNVDHIITNKFLHEIGLI